MTSFEIWSITAMFLGPIVAVLLTLWYQTRSEARYTKHRLFLTLMAYRKSLPVSREWVDALNTIDVVFDDEPEVIKLWHEYYALLHVPTDNFQAWEHKKVQLISAMARALGYKELQQVDIDKFYSPVAHGDQLLRNERIVNELLRVLENTGNLIVKKRSRKDKPKTPSSPQ